jgi:hypothetical protein
MITNLHTKNNNYYATCECGARLVCDTPEDGEVWYTCDECFIEGWLPIL